MSQTDLARRMKVSRPYITKVLRQDVNFSFRTAAKLANALKMDGGEARQRAQDGLLPRTPPKGRPRNFPS